MGFGPREGPERQKKPASQILFVSVSAFSEEYVHTVPQVNSLAREDSIPYDLILILITRYLVMGNGLSDLL